MLPQINPQGPLSDLACLHVADKSNMAAKVAKLEIYCYPVRIFWFLSSEGKAQNNGKLGYEGSL